MMATPILRVSECNFATLLTVCSGSMSTWETHLWPSIYFLADCQNRDICNISASFPFLMMPSSYSWSCFFRIDLHFPQQSRFIYKTQKAFPSWVFIPHVVRSMFLSSKCIHLFIVKHFATLVLRGAIEIKCIIIKVIMKWALKCTHRDILKFKWQPAYEKLLKSFQRKFQLFEGSGSSGCGNFRSIYIRNL